ncbi:MAG: hypothetical protein SF052_19335 [Bacteroidia bacterium]|nr:hypothetical protein [Bacteroidia bacterium]
MYRPIHWITLLFFAFILIANRIPEPGAAPAVYAHEKNLNSYCVSFDQREKNILIQTHFSQPFRVRVLDSEGHLTFGQNLKTPRPLLKVDFSRNLSGWYYVQLQLADGRFWGEWINV